MHKVGELLVDSISSHVYYQDYEKLTISALILATFAGCTLSPDRPSFVLIYQGAAIYIGHTRWRKIMRGMKEHETMASEP